MISHRLESYPQTRQCVSGQELTTHVTLFCFVIFIEVLQYGAKVLVVVTVAQLRAWQQRLLFIS